MKQAAVNRFRIGQSRSRPLGSPDKLPAVDGPVAKSPTGDCVNWLAPHERASFLSEAGSGHSCCEEGSPACAVDETKAEAQASAGRPVAVGMAEGVFTPAAMNRSRRESARTDGSFGDALRHLR